MSSSNDSALLQNWLDRLSVGDPAARAALIQTAEARLTRLTRKMLRTFPIVRRWELTDDVFQNSVLRIHRALADVTPSTVGDFMKFSAFLIRRELIDLSRHYCGPQGMGHNHQSNSNLDDAVDTNQESRRVEEEIRWTEFHEAVGCLPEELRVVFDLLWYQELPQAEVALLLEVSERTVQRRWLEARVKLHALLNAEPETVDDE